MNKNKKNIFLFLNTYVILDDGRVNSFFSSYRSKLCFGYLDLDLRLKYLKKEFDIKKNILLFYEVKEDFIHYHLYFDLEK